MLRERDLPNLSEEDLRMRERGRLAAALIAVVLVNVLVFMSPESGGERHAAVKNEASSER